MINDLRMDGDALFSESLYIYICNLCFSGRQIVAAKRRQND